MKRIEKAHEDKKLKVIWIGFQDKESKIKDFIVKHGIYKDVLYDKGDIVAKKFGIRYGAGLVAINKNGIVKKRIPRGFSEEKLCDAINRALSTTTEGGMSPP